MNAANKSGPAWLLYILKCNDNTLYTGITNDLARRFKQHNAGRASRYTRSRLPVELLYKERCQGKSNALKKEFRIKALSRKEKEKYIKEKIISRESRKRSRSREYAAETSHEGKSNGQ